MRRLLTGLGVVTACVSGPGQQRDTAAATTGAIPVASPEPDARSDGAGGRVAHERREDSAQVLVCVEPRGDTVIYRYEVRNGPRAPLRVIDIGLGRTMEHDLTDNPDGGGELRREPIGVRRVGDEYRILPPGAGSPPGWYATWGRIEETTGHFVTWHADSNQSGIAPGETRGGFSLAVIGGDTAYATGHWTLLVHAPRSYVGRLRRVACR